MDLGSLLRPDLVFTGLQGGEGKEVLRTVSEKIAETGAVRSSEELFEKLLERERVGSTAIGGGVAIPHCKLAGLKDLVVAVGVVPDGVDLAAPDDEVVNLLFLVISPDDSPAEHLKCLAAVSKWIRQDGNVERLRTSDSREEVCSCLKQEGAA